MSTLVSRRDFLRSSVAGGTGAILAGAGLAGRGWAADAAQGVCVTLCNHWSYIGIGWQLGIESCVLSVTDAMEMADRPPHVKTCINMDARAYEFMAEKFPEVAERLKKYLAAGKVELIGGTYGQPMGTTIGGESNIRQIVVGPGDDPQGARTTRWSRSSKKRSSPIRRSRRSPPWPASATPAWPSWTPGAGRAARARSSTPSTGRASTARRSLRAEERAVRLLARREAAGRLAGVQEARKPWASR